MFLSLYTFVKDGIYFDFHAAAMLKHHLPLADEIIVNEGYSSDGTYEQIAHLDPKIKVHRNHWDTSDPRSWSRKFKDQARRYCQGEWCVLLDCDEFIPEWEFDRLREVLARTDRPILPFRFTHFYGNYRVFNTRPEEFGWPIHKHVIHRNLDNLEVWGDGSNVRFQGDTNVDLPTDVAFECHHFGFVRHAARLRHKWHIQQRRNRAERAHWDRTPGFVFDLLPHRWDDEQFLPALAMYDGPLIQAVRDTPEEFVRDEMMLYHLLRERARPG